MSTVATVTRLAYSAASPSMTGAIDRHGPHHTAEKSTKAGCGDSSTRRSKSPSPTASNAFSFSIAITPLRDYESRSNGRHRRGLPAAAERLVDQHDRRVQIRFGRRDLVLGLQQRALGIEQTQEVERALAILDARELGGRARRRRLLDDRFETLAVRAISHECVLRFLERVQHRQLVRGE